MRIIGSSESITRFAELQEIPIQVAVPFDPDDYDASKNGQMCEIFTRKFNNVANTKNWTERVLFRVVTTTLKISFVCSFHDIPSSVRVTKSGKFDEVFNQNREVSRRFHQRHLVPPFFQENSVIHSHDLNYYSNYKGRISCSSGHQASTSQT